MTGKRISLPSHHHKYQQYAKISSIYGAGKEQCTLPLKVYTVNIAHYNLSAIIYTTIMILEIYQDEYGKEPLNEWLRSIKDTQARARIDNRLERMRVGHFGDCRTLGRGLYELRLHFGPGYRIYYGRVVDEIVILLAGGDKRNQTKDIKKAQQSFTDYKRNKIL